MVVGGMRRQSIDPSRIAVSQKQRLGGANGRGESKALYYTLASSTVLEKNTTNGGTKELDNVFLAAAKYGDMDILLRTLDRHNININVRDDTSGDTALILAAKGNSNKVVETLVERGADVTLQNEDGKGVLDLASNYLRLSVLSKYPKNPAHAGAAVVKAAWQGDFLSLKHLLDTHSGMADRPSEDGLSPLLVVTRDINTFLRLQRSIKLTYDPTRVVQELLRRKANVNAMDIEGHTALHFATRISAAKLCREIVEIILLYRPLLNILDRTNLAPLHTATSSDNLAVVSALVAAGANPNLHGIGGATPLHIGAQQENEEIVRKLLLAGGDVNALDSAGMTPLCVARTASMRALMKSLFASLAADKGIEVKLKYDELHNKRKFQKLLEPVCVTVQETVVEIVPKPDYKPLQRALINDSHKSNYNYNLNERVPRLVEGKKVTLEGCSRRRDSHDKPSNLFPNIQPENPVLLLKRHEPIEVPIQQRHQSRFKHINDQRGVFITQTQKENKDRKTNGKPRSRPPIPRHSCGFVKSGGKSRHGSAKRTSDVSRKISDVGIESEQWLPGAPMILGSSENSRPTSAVTGSSSQSQRGPRIHLKHVLKNILANMEESDVVYEDLLDRYVSQQRPVRVKEMGFVDFLLQDNDPEYRSDAGSSIRSHNFSDASSMSGHSVTSAAGVASEKHPPILETLAAARITIGETTPHTPSVNLPQLRQMPAPAREIDQPLAASSKPGRRASIARPKDIQPRRPSDLALRRDSCEDARKVPVVNIGSPYGSPSENPARISSRSSKDSGYGSMATLPNRSSNNEQPEHVETPSSALEEPPKHVTAVVVNQEIMEQETKEQFEQTQEQEQEQEQDSESLSSPDVVVDEPEIIAKEEKIEMLEQKGPIVGVVLQGQRMKTNTKLSNARPPNKFKEQTFKKKVYSRRLPQIKEESRTGRNSALARLKRKDKRVIKSAKSGTSDSSGDKETTASARPGTVPSKPILGFNLPAAPKVEKRPKTGGKLLAPPQIDQSISASSSDKESEEMSKEISEITTKHDKDLLNRLSVYKDLDALISTSPLQLEFKQNNRRPSIESNQVIEPTLPRRAHPDSPGNKFDNRSLFSERRSVLTYFTGTTKIESIMGDTTQWKKGRLLGSGGGGKVWYGFTQEKIEVAVKQIELIGEIEQAKDEYFELQEEVKLLKCLKHDNIIRYYGTCLQESSVNIFMEFVDGGSLAARLKKNGPLAERTIQSYTYQLLDALKYIHAKNIVHRDIKGQNILVTTEDKIKLIDFGCGKRLRRSLQNADALKTMRGTPYWMSPEVITGNGHGTKSDIWSLSCTVYEMLTGNPPWHSLPTMAAIYKIGTGRPIPSYPDNASDYCIDFMKASFVVDTKARPSAEELMRHEFIELFSNRMKSD